MQKQYEKHVWETSNDTYSLSVRVQTTINHISICLFTTILTLKKIFFFRARAEKDIALKAHIYTGNVNIQFDF